MGTIVTIGGGSIRRKDTLKIDKEIVRLTGKKNPKFLFIPTASSDDKRYWNEMQKYYGRYLGCKTDVLWLLKDHPNKKDIAEKISNADIIYVGGGNTLKMMRRWRYLGVDRLLQKTYADNAVLCGLSAGSICWYEYGHSDSLSYYNPKKWKYIRVKGLGLIKGTHCPHFDSATRGVPRKGLFKKMISETGGIGIAVDDNCAIIFRNDSYRVISSKKGSHSYRVYKTRSRVATERIEEEKSLRPTSNLYSRSA